MSAVSVMDGAKSGERRHPTLLEEGALAGVLARLSGKRIYCFENPGGNNGDRLIYEGSAFALRSAGAVLVETPEQAEVIVFTGGFYVSDKWPDGLDVLKDYNERLPDTPIVLLPQSFWFTTTDFPSLFASRRAPAQIFVRETTSYDIIKEMVFPGDVSLGLGDDMALSLRGAPWRDRYLAKSAAKHIIVIERIDKESPHNKMRLQTPDRYVGKKGVKGLLKQFIPMSIKRGMRRKRAWNTARTLEQTSTFAAFAQETVRREHPDLADLPIAYGDISLPDLVDFDGFCSMIAEAGVVFSDRLHGGICAAMLDKPTYIRPSDNHKIPGIHALSLTEMSHVTLLDRYDGAGGRPG